MKCHKTARGFNVVVHPVYPNGDPQPIVQESSAIGCHADSFDKPGSSFLWIGASHHLDREEVTELIRRLAYWLDHGRLGDDTQNAMVCLSATQLRDLERDLDRIADRLDIARSEFGRQAELELRDMFKNEHNRARAWAVFIRYALQGAKPTK